MNEYMKRAKENASNGISKKEGGPFGAVIVDKNGNVIADGNNKVILNNDPTAHAEVVAIRNLAYETVIVVSINRIEIPVQAIVNVIDRLKEKGYYIQYIRKSIDSVGNYKVTMNIESKTDESSVSLYTDEDADDEAIGIIEEAFHESGIKINTAFVDPTYGNPF